MGEENLVRTLPPQYKIASDAADELSMNLDDSKAIDGKENIFQAFNDNECCIIPSPMLKVESLTSYFGSDLTHAIQIIGIKYNQLLSKYQEQNDIASKLKAEFNVLSNKCLKDCVPKYEELKNKYTRECYERRRLYNEIIELKGNIRVFCRCRPLSSEEISKGSTSVVEFDPFQHSELQVVLADGAKKQFRFDHVFNPKDDQEAVFAETLPVVKSVLDGYNVCIFAYGQTGTGKTFTMEGNSKNRGVNYRALEELFKSSTDKLSTNKTEISVSMLEVYNEKIRDLLVENSSYLPVKKLDIKQINGTQEVPGLIDTKVSSLNEVLVILQNGAKNRSVGSTNANELSSRSHCLVRVTVKVEKCVSGEKNKSHMWLVDLAGSERAGKTEAEGERLKESQFINKSLSALGDVIAALALKSPHVPYRNSKLTHLLQSSLGGDCKTLMFTQISPSSADLVETLCSLNFATRVRGIEFAPAKKQFDPAESFKIKQMTEKLRHEEKENAKLRETLQLMQLKYSKRENVFQALQEKLKNEEQVSKNLQMKVRELESRLADEKKAAVKSDSFANYFKPQLAPIFEKRQPLSQISTNSRISLGSASRTSTITTKLYASRNSTNNDNKENMFSKINYNSNGKANSMYKARRISQSPAVRNTPNQPLRRASTPSLPSQFENHTKYTTIASQLSQMRLIPKREKLSVSLSTLSLKIPNDKGVNYSSFSRRSSCLPYGEGSSGRFYTPINRKAVLKSRIPTTSASASFSLPAKKGLRVSVQKRVVISPTAASSSQRLKYSNQQRSSMGTVYGGVLAGFGNRVVGGLGVVHKGVVTNKRRKSVV